MSASRLLVFGTPIFRTIIPRKTLFPRPPLLLSYPKTFPSLSLHFHRYTSSSADVDTVTTTTPAADAADISNSLAQHPWPEWVTFVDRLKSRGYLIEKESKDDDAANVENVYQDMNLLKDACLSFGRHRYDVFKSLSVTNIQTVVGSGCPNLLRKVVNSAKRLRAYLRLDEGDVCSACNLRGSCDRSYVILKGTEADARTVDIVRLILVYALDPLVISGGEKPLGRELIEGATRKLLTELVELSETDRDPALPEPTVITVTRKERNVDSIDDKLSQDVEMKRGDWICPQCNFMNFSRNLQCLKCKEEGPKKVDVGDNEVKKGDWKCPECSFANFARNIRCLKCKAQGPKRVSGHDIEMKAGDWNCIKCGFMNFASNKKCFRCQDPRPKRELYPGDWECPSCEFPNYKRNVVCRKCKCERPKELTTERDEHVWRSPY